MNFDVSYYIFSLYNRTSVKTKSSVPQFTNSIPILILSLLCTIIFRQQTCKYNQCESGSRWVSLVHWRVYVYICIYLFSPSAEKLDSSMLKIWWFDAADVIALVIWESCQLNQNWALIFILNILGLYCPWLCTKYTIYFFI